MKHSHEKRKKKRRMFPAKAAMKINGLHLSGAIFSGAPTACLLTNRSSSHLYTFRSSYVLLLCFRHGGQALARPGGPPFRFVTPDVSTVGRTVSSTDCGPAISAGQSNTANCNFPQEIVDASGACAVPTMRAMIMTHPAAIMKGEAVSSLRRALTQLTNHN